MLKNIIGGLLFIKMLFKELDKNEVIKKAQMYFLSDFPLQEIDNIEIRKICKDFRFQQYASVELFSTHLQSYNEYFYNWAYNNWMINIFYFRKR